MYHSEKNPCLLPLWIILIHYLKLFLWFLMFQVCRSITCCQICIAFAYPISNSVPFHSPALLAWPRSQILITFILVLHIKHMSCYPFFPSFAFSCASLHLIWTPALHVSSCPPYQIYVPNTCIGIVTHSQIRLEIPTIKFILHLYSPPSHMINDHKKVIYQKLLL